MLGRVNKNKISNYRRESIKAYFFFKNGAVQAYNPPAPQMGNYKYFVLWDYSKTGGRYYECNLVGKLDTGKSVLEIKAHDGDRGSFSQQRIFHVSCAPAVGDMVIAYWDNRGYAFQGIYHTFLCFNRIQIYNNFLI